MADEDDDGESVETEAPAPMGVAGWVVTYGDMMSLLLCFFILLFIFAKDEENKYMDALASIKDAFGVQTKRPQDRFVAYSPSKEQKTEDVIKEAETDLFSTMQQVVSDVVRTDPDLRQSLRVEMEETGVKLTVLNDKLFYPGTAYLHPRNRQQLLRPVLEASHRNNFNIIVRNNSTQNELDTRYFPSVWEMSGARAGAALYALLQAGGFSPSRVRSVGLGDSAPLFPENAPNASANNRTEFVFYFPGKEIW
ncbi:MAG: OmpA family protein [Deltaproteobacteria bacterium]|jgi:chemotaxis protein MotB|nr:OmpA family protein [Deltaproteobacteria bacterium]